MKLLQEFENRLVSKLSEDKEFPKFKAGDTVRVHVKVDNRVQLFEGVCIRKRNKGYNSSFTLRKISHGEGVERLFLLYSPVIAKIERVRSGKVRRAKLYYLRNLRGKAARIVEQREYN